MTTDQLCSFSVPVNFGYSPLTQSPCHLLQRLTYARQLVFAEYNQAFVGLVVGGLHKLHNLRIDRDCLTAGVGQG